MSDFLIRFSLQIKSTRARLAVKVGKCLFVRMIIFASEIVYEGLAVGLLSVGFRDDGFSSDTQLRFTGIFASRENPTSFLR